MSEGSFYVRWRGRLDGPYSQGELKRLVAAGRVSRLHDVSADRAEWRQAKEWPELQPPPPAASHPPAEASTSQADGWDEPASEQPTQEVPAADAEAEEAPAWYCEMGGQVEGPYATADMLRMVSEGMIGPQTRVSSSLAPERWDFVRDVPALADAVVFPENAPDTLWDTTPPAAHAATGPSTVAAAAGWALSLMGAALVAGAAWSAMRFRGDEGGWATMLASGVAALAGLVSLGSGVALLSTRKRTMPH